MVFYTIGVYGTTEQEFFEKLLENEIDTFIDIRRRRAVRGSQYSFANSNKLQDELGKAGIRYIHILELSPTNEIRNMQYAEDEKSGTSQRKRQRLSKDFISAYKNQILKQYSLDSLINELKGLGSKRAVLFCVEKNPGACHRSLVAEKLERDYNMKVIHLL
jgi:uncharacterized protein (DUF488 family)